MSAEALDYNKRVRVLVLYSSPWQVLCSPRQLPSLCREPFPICCKTSMCRRDVTCNPSRPDKWQKMRFFLSHPLFSPVLRPRLQWRRICLSSSLVPPQTLHPCFLWDPKGETGSCWRLSVTTLTSHGGDSPTQPRGDRAVKKPPWPQRHSLCQRAVSLRAPNSTGRDSH